MNYLIEALNLNIEEDSGKKYFATDLTLPSLINNVMIIMDEGCQHGKSFDTNAFKLKIYELENDEFKYKKAIYLNLEYIDNKPKFKSHEEMW